MNFCMTSPNAMEPKPMHPSSSRAFQRHQQHHLKHPSAVDLITTKQNKTNYLPSYFATNNKGSTLVAFSSLGCCNHKIMHIMCKGGGSQQRNGKKTLVARLWNYANFHLGPTFMRIVHLGGVTLRIWTYAYSFHLGPTFWGLFTR